MKYDIAIFDEVHNITPLSSVFFDLNHVSNIVALTATKPVERDKIAILERLRVKDVYTLTLDQAVAKKVVSPYNLHLIGFELDSYHRNIMAGNKNRPFYTTEAKQYKYLNDNYNAILNGDIDGKLKYAGLKRMHFIYGLPSKVRLGKFVLKKFISPEERTLIFAGNVKVATELEPKTFHAKSSDVFLKQFMNEEINRLSSVGSLNEGMNIANLDSALITQIQQK